MKDMEIKKYAESYGVNEELLQQLIDIGIFENLKDRQKNKIKERISTSLCLYSLGLDLSIIKEYLMMEDTNKHGMKRKIEILHKVRKETMERMHVYKHTLEMIDGMFKDLKSKEE